MRLRRARFRAAENLGREASAFSANCVEQICGFYGASGGMLFSQGHDFPHPWRYQYPFPQSIFAGSERATQLRVDFDGVDSIFAQAFGNGSIGLFEQCDEQMFDPDVVVIMISALLLGCAQNAAGGWTESREQFLLSRVPSSKKG